jgi:hypothetical protein
MDVDSHLHVVNDTVSETDFADEIFLCITIHIALSILYLSLLPSYGCGEGVLLVDAKSTGFRGTGHGERSVR